MINKFKKCKTVMLATNEKATASIFNADDHLFVGYGIKLERIGKVCSYNHLYIISNEKFQYPKDGTFYYDGENNIRVANTGNMHSTLAKNIIATTDLSLNIPHPSPQFIEKYIEEYNKGNVITDIMVEYEYLVRTDIVWNKQYNIDNSIPNFKEILKVNSEDNNITIKNVKDSWTEQEVTEMVYHFASTYAIHLTKDELRRFSVIHQWIINNL